ncbi:hypothetical protein LG634_02960 [Streptomyces bambusae]|uniref:hypothetical protein n=1 Tax=Streptomyces bambusae TaxID=1550616 RepID=UPI001CFEBC3A|nr:hypothetical protein [Streptomyces bambusae]MCB5163804.1 hypothetical protein [Streptomyces bambusae]
MLDTPEAVFEALRENNERPHGLPRTVTAEELAEAAEPFEQPDVLVTALLELMSAYEFTGEHRKAPVVFARLLKLWEDSPGAFSEWEAHQVFWRFKWVTTSLLQVPEVPLATVNAWVDRMAARYREAGHALQPVAAMRHHVAAHIGAGTEHTYDLWATRPRTDLSDCEACEVRQFAWHHVTAGDDDAALDIWHPVLDGDSSCSEEPQMSQARALLPLLRTGRTDEARSHHLTGYRRVRGNTGMLHEAGLHLEFCALSRNEGRGLEILAENRPLFEATGAPLDRLGFLTGVELLLARIVADGHGEAAVAGPLGRSWTAAGLLAHVRAEAEPLAASFDARNGTTAVGDRRRARLAQQPLLAEPLPLGLQSTLVRSGPAQPGALAATAVAPAAAVTVPEDFVELVREARRLAEARHPGDSRLWQRIGERLANGTAAHDVRLGPAELLRAELAEERAFVLAREDGRNEEILAELEQAAELYDGLGRCWDALSARTRGFALTTNGLGSGHAEGAEADGPADVAEVRALIEKTMGLTARLLDEAPPTEGATPEEAAASGAETAADRVTGYLGVLHSCAYAAYHAVHRQWAEAGPERGALSAWFEEVNGRLRTEAERFGRAHHVANARQFGSDVAGALGDLDTAEAALRAAIADVTAAEMPWRTPRPRARLAQLLLSKGEFAEASDLLHQALAEAVRHDDTDFPVASTYALLGHAASHLGDSNGAVRHFAEGAARHDREGAFVEATELRLQLTEVLAGSGRQADAVAVLESVVSADEACRPEHERMMAQVRLMLARGLRDLDEHLPAAEELLRLADIVAGWKEEDGKTRTLVASEAAVALAAADRWDAAGTAYERAVASHAEAPHPAHVTEMMAEFARLTMAARGADGLDTALGHLAQADAVIAAVPEDEPFVRWHETGAVAYRRARVLAEAERFSDALVAAEAAVTSYEEGGEPGELPRAEAVRFAALVEGNGLGRYDDAMARLATAADRCRTGGHPDASRILESLRDSYRTNRPSS